MHNVFNNAMAAQVFVKALGHSVSCLPVKVNQLLYVDCMCHEMSHILDRSNNMGFDCLF